MGKKTGKELCGKGRCEVKCSKCGKDLLVTMEDNELMVFCWDCYRHAVPTMDIDDYSKMTVELTSLKQRIDEIDEQWVYNFIAENSAKYFHYDTLKETFSDKFDKSMAEIDGELSKKIAVAIHDKIKEV
jgi:hypothetical protein